MAFSATSSAVFRRIFGSVAATLLLVALALACLGLWGLVTFLAVRLAILSASGATLRRE